jgi:hypothetical protein
MTTLTSVVAYLKATRHPWACLVFVLPLLAAYEGGVLWLGSAQPDGLRNGADTWLRWVLEAFGLSHLYWPPALLALILIGWGWRRGNRPPDMLSVWIGMGIESMVFAVCLWGLSRGLAPFLESLGILATAARSCTPEPAIEQIISYVGAGVYEETLFRLLLYSGLAWLGMKADLPRAGAFLLAAGISAVLFSAAHNMGPYGEPYDGSVFLFRALAGLYFVLLFRLRGFGIAVGTHTGYDVLVGVLIPNT